MAIKNYLLIIIFLIIVFIVAQNFKSINENFSDNYISEKKGEYNFFKNTPSNFNSYSSKNITIQFTNNLLNPLILNFDSNSTLQIKLNKKLISLFPFKKKSYKNMAQIILSTNKNKNIISYINEDVFLMNYLGFNQKGLYKNYYLGIKKNTYKNLRYACAISYCTFTLITPLNSEIKDWKDLKNKNIGTLDNSPSLLNLKKFLHVLKYQKEKVNIIVVNNKEILKDLFMKKKIDAIYLTIEHPSSYIQKIAENMKIRLITTKGLPKDRINMVFPFIFKTTVDIRYYDTYPDIKPIIDGYATRLLLITNINTKPEIIYNFLKTFFINNQFLRKDIKELDNSLPSFSAFNYAGFPYHKGAEKFYIENNFITYDKHNLCSLYYGINKCNTKMVNKNRFLENHGDPLNNIYNYTILNPKNKWNNKVNDWNYNEQHFKESYEYINFPEKPLLISNISLNTVENNVFKNFVEQIKKYPHQIMPNL